MYKLSNIMHTITFVIIDRAFKLSSCHIRIANVAITDIDHIRLGDKITRILCNNRGGKSNWK